MACEDEDLYVKHPHRVNGWEIGHGFQGWTITDDKGKVRARFSNARMMAIHTVLLMQELDLDGGGDDDDLERLEVDDGIERG